MRTYMKAKNLLWNINCGFKRFYYHIKDLFDYNFSLLTSNDDFEFSQVDIVTVFLTIYKAKAKAKVKMKLLGEIKIILAKRI